MKNATLILFIFSAFGLFAQNAQYETLKCLFYDLDIDSTDNYLMDQIDRHPVQFVSTDKVDTIKLKNGYAYTLKTPKVMGMPEYRVFERTDQLQADSTFLFLGGGAGIRTSGEEQQNMQHYTIETIEVTRYFSEEQGIVFGKICEELSDLFPESQSFDWNSENRSSYTISLGRAGKDLFEKQLVLEYYEFTDEQQPKYIISLSYEKQIPNEVI